MILEKGNMWDVFHDTDIFMITTNPIRRTDGAVVMGRGIALEAKTKFPQLPYDFGKELDNLHPEIDQAYVGQIGVYNKTPIWFFMVKSHWKDNADLGIIGSSCFYLKNGFAFGDKRIDLNFPGIGNGHLPRDSVLYLLEDLPDNIHIWEYACKR
jgi:hypothetical protein